MVSIDAGIAAMRRLVDSGDYKGAKQSLLELQAAFNADESSIRLLVEEGHIERKCGDILKAIDIFSRINRLSKRSSFYDLGICYRRANAPELAQLFLIREELRSGVTEFTRIERSLAYQMSSKFEQAKLCLIEALSLGIAPKNIISAICKIPFLSLAADEVQVIVSACINGADSGERFSQLSEELKSVNFDHDVACTVPFHFLLNNRSSECSSKRTVPKIYSDRVKGLLASDDSYLNEIDQLLRDGTFMYIDELVLRSGGAGNSNADSLKKIDMFSFWDTVEPPDEVKENIVTWAHIAESVPLYSERMAQDFILKNFDEKVLRCFDKCHHPAMKSDLFRILKLSVDGGLYIDADERLISNLDPIIKLIDDLEVDRLFVVDVMSDRMYLHNYAIFCRPNDEIVKLAIEQAVDVISEASEDYLRGKIWKVTGPGNLSKAVLGQFISDCTLIPRTAFISSIAFRKIFYSPDLSYKADPQKNWRHH